MTQEVHEKSHSLRDGLERGKTGRTRYRFVLVSHLIDREFGASFLDPSESTWGKSNVIPDYFQQSTENSPIFTVTANYVKPYVLDVGTRESVFLYSATRKLS